MNYAQQFLEHMKKNKKIPYESIPTSKKLLGWESFFKRLFVAGFVFTGSLPVLKSMPYLASFLASFSAPHLFIFVFGVCLSFIASEVLSAKKNRVVVLYFFEQNKLIQLFQEIKNITGVDKHYSLYEEDFKACMVYLQKNDIKNFDLRLTKVFKSILNLYDALDHELTHKDWYGDTTEFANQYLQTALETKSPLPTSEKYLYHK